MRDFIASQNSERLRQRLTGAIRVREPAAFARLAKSLLEIALVTGIIARLYRMLVLMASVHLSRFPIRDWLWRAPAFAAAEGVFESLASLILIAIGREPLGSNGAARFSDWTGIAIHTVVWRVVTISLFALLLAGVVKWVRYMILRKEHAAWSEGTVRAGIPGEGLIERRGSRSHDIDPLLFGDRRKHDKKRS